MTIEFLTKANKIIKAGLRAHTTPEEAPRPCSPKLVHTVLHGREIIGIPFHVVPEPDIEWNSTVGRLEPKPEPEPDRCVWCCPTTCANCGIEHCSDRLAGGNDATP